MASYRDVVWKRWAIITVTASNGSRNIGAFKADIPD
jgi:hypothetical protein